MYATNDEIFLAIKPMLPPGSDEFSVVESWAEMACGDVDTELAMAGLTTPAEDIGNFLKLSQICFYMDIAKNLRQIETISGDVQTEMVGKYRKEYGKSMPMFFFAQGASRPFFQLLPTETFRMRAYKYVQGFLKAYFKETRGHSTIRPCVTVDKTSRGYGWEDAVEDTTEWRSYDPWGEI